MTRIRRWQPPRASISTAASGGYDTTQPRATDRSLHRKELLLDASDPDYARFAALTNQEEQAGLFATPSIIGHERAWSEQLSQCGLMIRDHDLCKAGE